MKRGAEKQLIKGDEEEAEEEENPGTGIKYASKEVLSSRPMKGLPNRSRIGALAPVPQPATTPSIAASQTPFNIFSNPTSTQSSNPDPFENSTITPGPSFPPTNSPFSVKPARPTEAKPDAAPPSLSSSNAFTPANVSSAPSTFISSSPSPFPIPSTAFTPTNTSKAFASLLSTSSSPTSTSSSNGSSDDSALLKLYMNLRGLNASLLSAVSKAVDDDAFVDLSSALEKYKEVRSTIQKGHVTNSSTTSGFQPSASSSEDKPAMPAPPTSFTGFGGFNLATSTSSSTSAPAPPTFAFGSSSNTGFGSSSNTGFGSSSNTGFGSSTLSSPFGATSASTPPATATVPKANTFGTASVPSSFKPFASTVAATTASAFGSSTTSSSTTTPAVGFAFGSSSAEKPKEDPKANMSSTEKKTLPFSFGTSPTPTSSAGTSLFGTPPPVASPSSTPKASTPAVEDGNAREGDEAGTEGGESKGSTPGLLAPNPHDEEGEGEENEETIHAVKSKAYRLKKDDQTGASSWAELGVGILRVKKDKTTASRRMLLRNSTNGKIHINFKIYVGMNPSVNKKAVSFVGHDNGVVQSYTLRVATEAQAKELKEAVEKEIEAIKAQ